MNVIVKQSSSHCLETLNPRLPQKGSETIEMGLGYCEMRCMRVKVSPGSYLSKTP